MVRGSPSVQQREGWYLLDKADCTKSQTTAQEPFGYFKAEPFGWRDCAETDEGAIALYEAPQPQADARDNLLAALENLLASITGGQKQCGHDFDCVCPEDQARAAIAAAKEL